MRYNIYVYLPKTNSIKPKLAVQMLYCLQLISILTYQQTVKLTDHTALSEAALSRKVRKPLSRYAPHLVWFLVRSLYCKKCLFVSRRQESDLDDKDLILFIVMLCC